MESSGCGVVARRSLAHHRRRVVVVVVPGIPSAASTTSAHMGGGAIRAGVTGAGRVVSSLALVGIVGAGVWWVVGGTGGHVPGVRQYTCPVHARAHPADGRGGGAGRRLAPTLGGPNRGRRHERHHGRRLVHHHHRRRKG